MRCCFSSGSICQSHGSIDHHQPRTNTDHIPHWNLGSSFSAVCPRPCFLTLMLDGCACCSLHHPLPALISYQSIHVTAFFFPAGFSKKKIDLFRITVKMRLVGSVLYTPGEAWLCPPRWVFHTPLWFIQGNIMKKHNLRWHTQPLIADKTVPCWYGDKLEFLFPICKYQK